MSLEKYSAIYQTRSKIDRLIISHFQECTNIQQLIDEMIENPSNEAAQMVDGQFERIADGLEAVRNAITTLAQVIVSDSGEIEEIDIVTDEHGDRLL